MKRTMLIFALVLTAAAVTLGDIPMNDRPLKKPAKAIDSNLLIRLDREAKEARLIIPKDQLRQLRAELEALDDGGDTAAAVFDLSRTQTIVSGVLLSLAFAFAGVWFMRPGRGAGRTAASMMVGAGVLAIIAFTGFVYANAGPPPEARSITGKIFSQPVHIYKFASGRIKLETSATETGVVLVVPDPVTKPAE